MGPSGHLLLTLGLIRKQEKAAEIYYELTQGTYIEEKNITFEEFAEEWLKMYEKTGVKPGSIRVRKHEMGHLITHFKYLQLKDITRRMFQNITTCRGWCGAAGDNGKTRP